MRDYFDLKNLPILEPCRRTLQVSSFDRKADNGDFGQFLYQDTDGSMVLFDERGKGCIRSIWSAIVTEETILSFYFDGSDEPRYTVSLLGLFTGAVPELSGVGNTLEERGHYDEADCRAGNCFIPIPYTNGLKITATGKLDFYYHIMYEKYTDDVDMTTVGGRSEAFCQAFAGERPALEGSTFEKSLTLTSMYTNAFQLDAPGVITKFTVIAAEGTRLEDINLDISWDGELISQVAAPLLYMFAQPFGFTEVHTHAVDTYTENGQTVMSLYLPMPFWKSATITLVNMSDSPIELTLQLTIEENTYLQQETGYFHADFRKGLTELFDDWLIGDFFGRGHIVGIIQTCHGGQYCEGNEHFYINGAHTPQINGTGTEDFYLGCYWPNLKYDSPCAGCVNDVYLMNDSTVKGSFKYPAGYYRFLHDMPISFVDGIRLAIQHGAVGQTYSDYSSLCLSYRQPDGLFTQTDFIYVGSAVSRSQHEYTSDNADATFLAAKVEAERKAPILEKDGFLHKKGKIQFQVAILPENDGVCLRRLYDQSLSPQGGTVYVDGVPVGEWYNPGYNTDTAFADHDFYIPASVATGKEVLHIEIDVQNIFSDFEYTVFTIWKV